jgi:hypothetical protein
MYSCSFRAARLYAVLDSLPGEHKGDVRWLAIFLPLLFSMVESGCGR